jgi:hypothetical protein
MTSDINVDDINDDLSDEEEVIKPVLEEIKTIKTKRIMSEKQLENLKKAREIAKIKLNQKKKETTENKKKEVELKLLQKLEKNLIIDKQLEDLKEKIKPEEVISPKIDDDIIYIKKTKTVKPKKKVVYISETDSDDEEVVYKKKSKKKEAPIDDLNIRDVRKRDNEKLLEQQYNEKCLKIKQEFLMEQLFPK